MSDAKLFIKNGVFGILERNGKVLLGLRSPDDTSFPNCWCHPGGGVEFQESIDAALKREFLEEVLLSVEVFNNYLGVHEYRENGRHVILVFKEVKSDSTPTVGDGFVRLEWFSIDEIRMLHLGGDTTPLTIVAAEAWNCHRTLERENQQLKADLKENAIALNASKGLRNWQDLRDKALSQPITQSMLKDK